MVYLKPKQLIIKHCARRLVLKLYIHWSIARPRCDSRASCWLRYGDLTIFKMAVVRHLGFLKFAVCHVALVDMPFCFHIQNFAEIGESVELWQKNQLSRWRPPPSWIFKKISIFGHVTVMRFNICCSVSNFIIIAQFFTEIWWFSDLQNGGRPPSWICCDVTILHRRTHFRCPNISLKFHVDRCCSFRDKAVS